VSTPVKKIVGSPFPLADPDKVSSSSRGISIEFYPAFPTRFNSWPETGKKKRDWRETKKEKNSII
jgi:hypothetical protein